MLGVCVYISIVWIFDIYEGWINWCIYDFEIGFGFLRLYFSYENLIYD